MKSFAFAAALVASVNAWGYQAPTYTKSENAASAAYGKQYEGTGASDWDAWGRDQDLSIEESYGSTQAKSYSAESYDEWDNQDRDKWGAQAWGKDRDLYGASSQGYAASAGDYGSYGKDGSYGAAGKAGAASAVYGAAKGAYDNDQWAKQAYGQDYDSRWGKSYDSVAAKSYDNQHYAKQVRADDDQWAEDYDRYGARDANGYGKAASADSEYGWSNGYGKGGEQAASAAYGAGYYGKQGSDWDAWGRDQDYSEDVSYDMTWAKSYEAESYDEWDNADRDKWGAQAWGKDRDVYGASSYGAAASLGKYGEKGASYGYGDEGYGHGGYGQKDAYGGSAW